ncbi:MAG: methyltransferase domain-containing protein [Oscillospiraceae bacterium]|nr:methyltransferase domain-containing protein [Oscillospiraceae bacterium]
MNNNIGELGQIIPLHYHFDMLGDKFRTVGFRTAIDLTVPMGGTVLELGGGTGVLSYFAAQRAAKVYSVDINPELVEKARQLLSINTNGDRVEVIYGDAFEYIPPEPVDVVVCEMLHVGLLCEKQLGVIDHFKKNYSEHFPGQPLPIFVPAATVQAVQPVMQNFEYEGYHAPIVLFQNPYSAAQPRTKELGNPVIYHTLQYDLPYDLSCSWSGTLPITADGTFNAVRILTKNILAIDPKTQEAVEWYNQYLIVPLESEMPVKSGQTVKISFNYKAGDPLGTLDPIIG